MDANSFDITTERGLKLYRLRQAYTPDRWGFLGARSPYTPRFVQVALKMYFYGLGRRHHEEQSSGVESGRHSEEDT